MVQRQKVGAVMVVGGGVGGMRAAVDLADSGYKVYLVEILPAIGGVVAQLGFMFPTHDCVLCSGTPDHGYGCTRPSISPALLDFSPHPNVELMTLTEIVGVEGIPGDFKVTVVHNPRYVNVRTCVSCDECSKVCPVDLPDKFQMGFAIHKAVYKVAPRAVPNAYLVEKGEYCLDCRKCEEVCPTKAINLDEEPWYEEIQVGAIILSVGYKLYDPRPAEELGYGRYPNVVTGLEYERLASRSGPTEGIMQRPSNGALPQRIAWIQCVGSRDQEHTYCSSICCMYATKEAVLAKQRVPGVQCQVFMMDERAFSKEYNVYYEQARDMWGVQYTRCRISGIREDPLTHDLFIHYQDEKGELHQERFNMVVLAVGSEPPPKAVTLAQDLGIELNEYGFCLTDKFEPVDTSRPGVFVAGAFSQPKEIAETVIDASGAAARAMRLLSGAQGTVSTAIRLTGERQVRHLAGIRGSRLTEPDYPLQRDASNEPPRLGVFACHCGTNITETVDVPDVVEYAKALPDVVHAQNVTWACLPEGLEEIKAAIKEHNLNRVVVAACTPRTHEALFQDILRQLGLNPYLLEFVSIRDHCAWVHYDDPKGATRKAKELVRMGAARARLLQPVHRTSWIFNHKALVIGGGLAGMTAALNIADEGYDVYLVEKEDQLGGNLRNIHYTAEGPDPQRLLRSLIKQVECHERIDIYKNTQLVKFGGHVGNFRSVLRSNGDGRGPQEWEIEHGVAIVATGAQEYRGTQYLHGLDPRVLTQLELEKRIVREPEEIAKLDEVVMIQCVRPYGEEADYCSRTCCTNTMKNAIAIKKLNPNCRVYVLYKDLITYGFREQYYTEARQRGVIFLRYTEESKPDVRVIYGSLRVTVEDPIMGDKLVFHPNLLALSMATAPGETNCELARIMNLPLSREGFFMEAHLKLRPMDFVEEGIFLCGLAHYPKFIEETIAHALATAGRAMTILGKDILEVGGVIAVVDQSKCVGCLTCVRTCPFEIPAIQREAFGVGGIVGAAYIEPAKCTGCGTCTSECPANAIQLRHYQDDQVMVRDQAGLGQWLPA
ncbi:MAG: FAD-dependent oxidoreductase [Anaerolineae bacterium]|nr:FAD-dependent oxidoreductase [Anaerolineae bacterium]